jgi:predicted O-linked N-acetylglucosamine transferase (SPINDLY family)/glycosyltransferase involved in cell wall biosynthesis
MKTGRKNAIRRQAKQSVSRQPATSASSSVDLLLQKANAHHNAGRLPQAEALYRQVLQVSPGHPVALHLLGIIAYQVGNGALSLELINKAILLKPDYAEAYCNRGITQYALQQYQEALESCGKAILLKPEFAEAYFNRGNALHALEQYQAALESFDKAIQCKPDYTDAYYNRGTILQALGQSGAALESYDKAILLKPDYAEAYHNRGSALHTLEQYQAALESFDKALLLKPDYAEASSNRANTLQAIEQVKTYFDNYEKAMRRKPDDESRDETRTLEFVMEEVARIAKITGKAEMKSELDALPLDLHSHPAVCALRNANFVKTESSGKDLVFYCFSTGEIWNPRTAATKGIGGSEEAVIWLSRLLHQRGWNVTVYAHCGAREEDFDGVSWKPYWMWNHRDKQDVTVIWRYPEKTSYQINSDKVILDLHDTIVENKLTPDRLRRIHKIFVKSRFHRSLFPHIPDEKFVIIPNGIDAELFVGIGNRDPLLLINTSSADRSLEAFLDCFEQIKKQVPNVKAQWAYGWGVWDSFYSSDAEKLQWKTRLQERMKELGVEERGRISHSEIAQLYCKANIFAYPSEFPEIDCISLSKAMAAGAIPVTTDFAAMGEKSKHGGVFIHSKKSNVDWVQPYQFHFEMTDPQQKSEFVREAVKLLLNPPSESAREPMREWARSTFDWNKIAGSWHEILAGKAGQGAATLKRIDSAAKKNPGNAAFDFDHGNELYLAQQYQAAIESFDRAILLKPDYAEAYCNRGIAQYALQQYREALESYDKAILLKPELAEAYFNRGNALHALQQYQAALESFDKALQFKPDYADAYYNRGTILQALGQFGAAIESYDKALLLKPGFAQAHNNKSSALMALQQYEAALECCDSAILFQPDIAEAHNNRGNALQGLERYHEALESYDRAILLNPDFADAHCNRANTLLALKNYQAALQSYELALRYKPACEYIPGVCIYMKRFLCDWEGIESQCRQLEAAVVRGERVVIPFQMLAIGSSPAIQRQAAEIYARDKAPARSIATVFSPGPKRDRVRIGYFSADYCNHVTSYLIAELFERHDRSKFEIIGFSFGPNTVDEMTRRISTAMDRFLDVRSMLDPEVAELSRKLEVDIAVDLNGFTTNSRPGIMAGHAAPIQINYLAYPGTMGADYMDYLIADPTLIPEADRCHYSEKIVYLPDSYQVNDSQRAISPMPCARIEEGLPETAFVFCCFNNIYKISPSVFDIWMRILRRVEGSVLWLLEDNPWAVDNLRKQAARRGIEPQRLIFAKRVPVEQHLARHRLADLVLDTLPYNAHTTASDALWTGLPVLTRTGETFASRVAASLLRAVGLPELITTTESEFEELAVALAHNPERLHALRQRLQQNHLTASLFDCQTYTRHLESAYSAIYERYHAGLPPDHIHIPRLPLSPSS